MTDTELAELFGTASTAPEPALPPGYVEGTLVRARRDVRRRRTATVAVLGAVLALVATATWWPLIARPAPPTAPPTGPTLPREFASFSLFTASATAHPPGRVIALYEQGSAELLHTWQTLVAGADRDTYRRVDYGDDAAPPALLSPLGTRVLFTEARATDDEFTMLDLTTGRSRRMASVHWISNVGGSMRMLAWSWDGRYVAYAVPVPPPASGLAADSFFRDRVIDDLAILDTFTNTSVRYPQITRVLGAAFAPDGRLAVQVDTEVWIVNPASGVRQRTLDLPSGMDLVPSVGWSPDAALLAVAPMAGNSRVVRFLDATGGNGPVPADLADGPILGWRTPSSVVIQEWLPDEETEALTEASLVDGGRTVLSRFSNNNSCEYGLQRCNVYRVQLAACLLMEAGLRDPDPDRGPYLAAVRAVTTVLILTAIGGIVWWVRRRRQRVGRLTAPD